MSIVAKPVVDKQFWILQRNNEKVGNIEAVNGGYQVKIDNQVAQFKTIKMVEQRADVHFEPAIKHHAGNSKHLVHGFPVAGRIHNPIWDVQQKLPLYTKTKKSKSWFAAGWYTVKKGRNWAVMQNPKLILLQRYTYTGPFYDKETASTAQHD
jgi:hypothetical protein